MLLKAALNGNRLNSDNPAVPITPAQLADDAKEAVSLGAGAIHVHPRSEDGLESFDWADIEPVIGAIRAACPGVPIGISTREGVAQSAVERFEQCSTWDSRLDFASVNFHEPGSIKLARKLIELNIGVEAGLFTTVAAENLVASGLAERCLRIMFEPADVEFSDALITINGIEEILDRGKINNSSRLLHGYNKTAWSLLVEAKKRGYDSRIGFEDTLFMPDGTSAKNNAELVKAALKIISA